PSFQCPTQSGDPNWIPSVLTRHFNPPSRVGENGTPIRSLFGILDLRVICPFNAQPNPGIQIGFRQFLHVTLTHPIRHLKAQPNPGIQIGFRQFSHVTLTHPIRHFNAQPNPGIQIGFL
ncbi:hypothetical protein Taro_055256, partial [Colocasia esculenta]|nr:hypothetical protein [Colocasia esculenta]